MGGTAAVGGHGSWSAVGVVRGVLGVDPRRLPLADGELQSDGGVWEGSSGMKDKRENVGILRVAGYFWSSHWKNLGIEMLVDDEAV